jgi:gas vesicle protein
VTGVKEKIVGAKDSVTGTVSTRPARSTRRLPSKGELKQKAKRGASVAQQNPLGLAVGSVALGFLAGMLIPETKVEHEKLGPVADQVKDQVQSTAQDALEHGKQVAQDVAETAQSSVQQVKEDVKSTAQESAQQHGQQVASSAQDSASQVREQVQS